LPSEDEVEHARRAIERLQADAGASALSGGELVDAAMLGAAREIVALAERYGTGEPRQPLAEY
jgi:citrate lyase beta subunit